MIQTIPLLPGITLRCFPDSRFKQGTLTLQLVRSMCREENALNALLPAVLLRGCSQYPDLRSITRHLDDLYGAAVGAVVRRVGDYQATGLSCGFMEDKYALDGDQVLAPMLTFLGQLLLEPVLENGAFRADYVESEKRNLIFAIESQRNDKRLYAGAQLTEHMCKADSFGIPRLGTVEQVAAITPKSLYDHYRKILTDSPMELFYVGAADPNAVAGYLRQILAPVTRCPMMLPAQTAFHDGGMGEYTEQMEVAQGKLCMGFTTPITLRCREFPAMQVFNTIFGAGMTCKLFMQIREKMSLCYDISSGYHGSKGMLTVSAGIDCKDNELVQAEILRQLEACQTGDITDAELSAAKQALISQLQATHDSPGAIEGYYATAVLSGLTLTPESYRQAVEAVTREDVVAAARSLQKHTVYFLKGVQ